MLRSMFAAISGLRNHQTMMDVVGNNISNVNTTGFKSSNTVFSEVLSQTVRGAGASTANSGGTNPSQIGLGSKVQSITTNFGQGAIQRTNRSTDFAIQGDGFFGVVLGGERLYTRAGSFSLDALGRVVTQDGGVVQGWQSVANTITTTAPPTAITVPVGDLVPPVRTTVMKMGGNLPTDAAIGATVVAGADVYDGQGTPIPVRIEFTKTAANTWSAVSRWADSSGVLTPTPPAAGTPIGGPLTFDLQGQPSGPTTLTIPAGTIPGFPTQALTVDLGDPAAPTHVTQFGKLTTAAVLEQDGQAAGSLQSFSVAQDGTLVGSYTNGRTRTIGQLALHLFSNAEGLEKSGGSTSYRATVNSGLPQVGVPLSGGRGIISGGALEMSNVDLAQEFTNLIIAQRGFQGNSRVVTTSDEMLQEVVNLKR